MKRNDVNKNGSLGKLLSVNLLIVLMVSISILASCQKSDEFEIISRNGIDSTTFAKSNTPIKAFHNHGYDLSKLDSKIKLTFKDHEQIFPNVVFIKYFGERYIGLITGLPTMDAGWKYFLYPTYSDLILLERKDLEIIFRKRIYEPVSDLNIDNGFVYFEYGEYPNLQYGRIPFEE